MYSFIAPPHDACVGLGIDGGGFKFDGTLVVEPPVRIAADVKFYETNTIGSFSYIGEGGRVLQTTIGRYCSVGEGVGCA